MKNLGRWSVHPVGAGEKFFSRFKEVGALFSIGVEKNY